MSEDLKSLADLPQNVAEMALANLALNDPLTATEDSSLGEIERNLTEELSASLASEDIAERGAKFYEILNTAWDRFDDATLNSDEIKEKAGTRGDLWPSLYRVELSSYAEQICRKIRVTKRLALDTVQRPDLVDHLNPYDFGYPEETFYSVSVKFFDVSLKKYGLIAFSQRNGDKLIIYNVWKFFVQDLDLSDVRRPVDVLRTFAKKYGTNIHIGEMISKFILYYAIPIMDFGDTPSVDEIVYIERAQKTNITSLIVKIDNQQKRLQVGIAYNINVEKYVHDLRKHGIKPRF